MMRNKIFFSILQIHFCKQWQVLRELNANKYCVKNDIKKVSIKELLLADLLCVNPLSSQKAVPNFFGQSFHFWSNMHIYFILRLSEALGSTLDFGSRQPSHSSSQHDNHYLLYLSVVSFLCLLMSAKHLSSLTAYSTH